MDLNQIKTQLKDAQTQGKILASTLENAKAWLNPDLFEGWVIESISELVQGAHWAELNDRFYKTLAFGTGGIRGRTIGRVITKAEQGSRPSGQSPQHAAVGSNCMNDFNVRRATMGLVAYVQSVSPGKAHLVFAHDPRHFSRHFAELAANTVVECGGKASLFESERSTPELSFSVRHLAASAGVVITASHNPPHDNGFKAYFNDGAQVVEPHASGIIQRVNAISMEKVCDNKSTPTKAFELLGAEIDKAYIERLHALILEPQLVREQGAKVKVVYSPLHGTGVKVVPSLLKELGIQTSTVDEQMILDGRFPTVKSPNPENAEALTLSLALAEKEKAGVVLATDPDADRMGVAVRGTQGKMELLSGNQIGSLLAHYRLERLFSQGILNAENRGRVRLIKTVVTTDLQKAVAEKFGVGITDTLTGFKYIGEKLRKYEEIATKAAGLDSLAYRKLSENEKRSLLLKHSFYYVFGGEESYGYSASDFARDKDANAASVMFAELAAYTQSKGQTILDYLNAIYSELGYYQEKLGQLVYEGAEGSQKIKAILQSYEKNPPKEMAGIKVTRILNYSKQDIRDSEGDLMPKELLMFVDLANGARYGVRGSGTEPKIKFYLFAHEKPKAGSSSDLSEIKSRTSQFLESLWKTIEADAQSRAS